MPFIQYKDSSYSLIVQVSIPKFLYGDNVTMITEEDIPLFFYKLQQRIQELFSVQIPPSEWTVIRCDVCWNFKAGKNVSEYVRQFSQQKLAYKNTVTYNGNQTVEYRNKSSKVMFYDKHKETMKKKEPEAIIDRSKGILRMEIQSSDNDMKRFSPTKKAIELLGKTFFEYMTEKTLAQMKYPEEVSQIEQSWLFKNKRDISKIETILGFQMLQSIFDEPTLRQLYTSSTYANRKNLIKKIAIPQGNCLSPLAING